MYILLYLGVFLYYLAMFMFIPFFVVYVTDMGGSFMGYGLILSLSGFVISIFQSYIGFLSDKFGSKKLVMYGGVISSLSLILMVLINTYSSVYILYIFVNIGIGLVSPSLFALICRIKTSKGESFIPYYRSIQGIGVIFGPIIGGYLISKSLKLNLTMSSSIILFSIIVFFMFFKAYQKIKNEEIIGKVERNDFNFWTALKEATKNKKFIVACILFVFIELSYDLIKLNIPIIGQVNNINTSMIGMSLSAYFLMFTLFQVPVNKQLKKINTKIALLFMGILSLIATGLLLISTEGYYVIVIMGMIGITIGSLFTYLSVMASESSPEEKKGTYMGVFNTILPFTDIVSPILVAFLVKFDYKLPYILAVILILIFTAISQIYGRYYIECN